MCLDKTTIPIPTPTRHSAHSNKMDTRTLRKVLRIVRLPPHALIQTRPFRRLHSAQDTILPVHCTACTRNRSRFPLSGRLGPTRPECSTGFTPPSADNPRLGRPSYPAKTWRWGPGDAIITQGPIDVKSRQGTCDGCSFKDAAIKKLYVLVYPRPNAQTHLVPLLLYP